MRMGARVSHPYQPFEIKAKSVPIFLENGEALVGAFSMPLKPRDREIRFFSASNAFSSYAKRVSQRSPIRSLREHSWDSFCVLLNHENSGSRPQIPTCRDDFDASLIMNFNPRMLNVVREKTSCESLNEIVGGNGCRFLFRDVQRISPSLCCQIRGAEVLTQLLLVETRGAPLLKPPSANLR